MANDCRWCGRPTKNMRTYCSKKCEHDENQAGRENESSSSDGGSSMGGCFAVIIVLVVIGMLSQTINPTSKSSEHSTPYVEAATPTVVEEETRQDESIAPTTDTTLVEAADSIVINY